MTESFRDSPPGTAAREKAEELGQIIQAETGIP